MIALLRAPGQMPVSQRLTLRYAPAIRTSRQHALMSIRAYSDAKSNSTKNHDGPLDSTKSPIEEVDPKPKTQAQRDQELLIKLQGLDGDGGAAGVEYEDGKPVSMKRSVRNNMFRYI